MQDYSQLERFGVHYCHPTPLEDYAYIPVIEVFYTYGVSDRIGGWTGSTDWVSRFNKAFVEYER